MVFAGGILKPGSEKEVPNRQKKWSVPATALGNAGFISDKSVISLKRRHEIHTFLVLLALTKWGPLTVYTQSNMLDWRYISKSLVYSAHSDQGTMC